MDIDIIRQTLDQITLITPSLGVYICLISTAFLLMLSGLASGSEIAFFSLSPKDLAEIDPEAKESDKCIEMLREDSERTLATILIVNNFVNVTIIMLCNYIFEHTISFGEAVWIEFLCKTVLLTFLLLLFGEIIPKVYSRQSPLLFCRRTYKFVLLSQKLFWPLGTMLMSTRVFADKLSHKEDYNLSVDELGQALEMTDKKELRDEESILQGIIRFGDETAREIMTSRQDIVDLDINAPYSDVLACVVENQYSRIPVYQGNEDNMRGILYIKDLLPHISKPATFRWQSLLRPPYFVPETKKIDDLMKDFQENKVHIAIVVDEFGGTSGIVTMEDILEEIVGEINDEFDDEKRQYTKLNYNTYIIEGKTLLTDLVKILNVDEDEFDEVSRDADTVAGMILEIKGDFPSLHERIDYKNYVFEVLEIDGRRISKVKTTVNSK